MNFRRYPEVSQKALKPIIDRCAELLSRDLSFDEIADRMSVSNAQVCVYFRMICERLGPQAA